MIFTEPETADIIPAFVFRDLLRRKVSVIIYDRLDCSYFMEKALRSFAAKKEVVIQEGSGHAVS